MTSKNDFFQEGDEVIVREIITKEVFKIITVAEKVFVIKPKGGKDMLTLPKRYVRRYKEPKGYLDEREIDEIS